jgi:hypothetical protein
MAHEVIRQQLPPFDEDGPAGATGDEHGRDLYYLPDLPEERSCRRRTWPR